MRQYYFESGKEEAVINLDDSNRIWIKNSKTNNLWLELTERLFPDRDKRLKFRLMSLKIPKLTSNEIDVYFISEFAKMGYKFIKKENE